MRKYNELIGRKEDLVSFFKKSPLYGIELDLKRDQSITRELDFGNYPSLEHVVISAP